MSLCLSSQAVLLLTPNWRPKASAERPFLACERQYMARNQVVRGNLVAWKMVPAKSETWRLQWLHWKLARRELRRQKLVPAQRRQAKPWGQRAWNRACSHWDSVPKSARN